MKANRPYIRVEKNTRLSAINLALSFTPCHSALKKPATLSLLNDCEGDQLPLFLELTAYLD